MNKSYIRRQETKTIQSTNYFPRPKNTENDMLSRAWTRCWGDDGQLGEVWGKVCQRRGRSEGRERNEGRMREAWKGDERILKSDEWEVGWGRHEEDVRMIDLNSKRHNCERLSPGFEPRYSLVTSYPVTTITVSQVDILVVFCTSQHYITQAWMMIHSKEKIFLTYKRKITNILTIAFYYCVPLHPPL